MLYYNQIHNYGMAEQKKQGLTDQQKFALVGMTTLLAYANFEKSKKKDKKKAAYLGVFAMTIMYRLLK